MIYAENVLICIAAPLVLLSFFTKGETKRFALTFVAGMCVCLISAYISGFLNMVFDQEVSYTSVYTAPVVEEAMKMVPVVLYMVLLRPADSSLRNFGLAIGAGFATYENCCYLLNVGTESLTFILVRGFAAGIMHIVSISALVFGLTISRRFHILSSGSVVGAAALAMIFHGIYNLLVSKPGVSQVIGYALPLAALIVMYYPYTRFFDEFSDQNL